MATKTKRRAKPTLPPLGGEPADWQEQHSPTEPVTVKISGTREMQRCRRRKSDARIWDGMTAAQEHAAVCIEWCHRFRTQGLGAKVQRFDRQSQGVTRTDVHPIRVERLRAYDVWRERYWNTDAVVAILVEGESLSEQDGRLGRRHGWAKENLRELLEVYDKLVGVPDMRTLAAPGKR